MVGGTGDDVYVVDDSGDLIVEDSDGDFDRAYIWTSSYTMAANLYAAHARYDGGITIVGNSGANQLWGGLGDDSLDGGGGNDLFFAGAGDDVMTGGTGNDSYQVDDSGDVVVEAAGGGTDIVYLSLAAYILPTWVENADLGYAGGARTLAANASNNLIIVSADSALTISAGGGTDTVDYSREGEALLIDLLTGEVDGAAADDLLTGVENLTGGEDDDELRGTAGANILDGYWGADTLAGRGGNDIYHVDDPDDLVVEAEEEGTDEVRLEWMDEYVLPDHVEKLKNLSSDPFLGTGNALNNDMTGGGDEDILHGGDGQDSLSGGSGDDFLHGEAGHDTLSGGTGEDWMAGGDGNDAYVADCEEDAIVELAGGGVDQVFASSSAYTLPDEVENLNYNSYGAFHGTGNALANIIYGGSAADTLEGLAGDDELRGGGGADSLAGADGADLLVGGAGADLLEGGAGADTFRVGAYESGTGASADSILDFVSGADLIDLSSIDADSGTAGDQAFAFIGAAAFSGTAGELRYGFDGTDTWLQADTNGDSAADFEIMLTGPVTPLAGDFVP
jgi:Ca2+-binding RTX toxin-like protein